MFQNLITFKKKSKYRVVVRSCKTFLLRVVAVPRSCGKNSRERLLQVVGMREWRIYELGIEKNGGTFFEFCQGQEGAAEKCSGFDDIGSSMLHRAL